ncbi:hypothetical protein [Cupriavidus pampae]|uniref:Proline-rich protein n=1 Tax=Cupriavidus pampae TaxID=659251 RepID=A0ABM8WAW6_9BURK|nr:hypothetical protein [Cupriavidus pampae]CAG9164424.1 hypothetical protein LMG32289_00767 [Cupriavidus pampae]
MVNPVFHKTEAGQEEIRTRARKLDHKLRALLLIVNGERDQSALLEQVGGMGVGQDAVDTLLSLGLIETSDLAAPASASPVGSAATASVPAADRTDAGAAAAAAEVAGGDGYRELYHFYTEVIGHHLGLRGYVLQVKVEKAATLVELAALRDTFGVALLKAKGDVTAHAIIGELDQLLAQHGVLGVVR